MSKKIRITDVTELSESLISFQTEEEVVETDESTANTEVTLLSEDIISW